MQKDSMIDISYFPGCSMATTAHENNQSLLESCTKMGVNLIELDDWNCCGSSSAHSVDSKLFIKLVSRNLAIAPPGRPLLAPCPSCVLRLREAFHHIKHDENEQKDFEDMWGKPFNPKLEILNVIELLGQLSASGFFKNYPKKLSGIKFVPYYGCTLNRPSFMRREKSYHGVMEKILVSLGAEVVKWPHAHKCCGTFHSVAYPEIVTQKINEMMQSAKDVQAQCIITPCAMCHLNMEVRCTLNEQLPTLHLSEVLALALGRDKDDKGWFPRHLIDPIPLLKSANLLS